MRSYFKNSSKKGQAALEFMMTYGWAILVVLAAIGALSYFGVLNPSRFTPDTCLASALFSCSGKPIVNLASGTVLVSIVNNQVYSVSLNRTNAAPGNLGVNYTGGLSTCTNATICTLGTTGCAVVNPRVISSGQAVTINVTGCTNFNTVSVVKGDIIFTYQNPDSLLSELVVISVTGKPR